MYDPGTGRFTTPDPAGHAGGDNRYAYAAMRGGAMRDLNELKLSVAGKPVTKPPPTTHQPAVVEQLVGVSLPTDYVGFLMFSNGGYPQLNTVYVDWNGYREPWSLSNFFSISADYKSTEDTEEVAWNYRHRWPNVLKAALPIARTAGGDLLCLDLREGSYGRVVVWTHDPPAGPLLVAASFEEFIDSLTVDPDVS